MGISTAPCTLTLDNAEADFLPISYVIGMKVYIMYELLTNPHLIITNLDSNNNIEVSILVKCHYFRGYATTVLGKQPSWAE